MMRAGRLEQFAICLQQIGERHHPQPPAGRAEQVASGNESGISGAI
jgi:hypothetical protein